MASAFLPLSKRLRRSAALLSLGLGLVLSPGLAHADWNAANDEANRQRMMNDMRASDARNDRLNFESQQRQNSYSSSSSSSGSSSSSSSSSSSGYEYHPYEYKPEGPKSVVASYTFTVYKQETEAQTIARIRKEAEAGNAQSQYNLGRIYYTGYGVAPDMTQARTWFCEAAKQDHPIARSQCGGMMYNGQGGPEDKTAAMAMLADSAAKAEPYGEALYGYFTLEESVKTSGADTPQPEAIAYMVKAADEGQVLAQTALGSLVYYYGVGGEKTDGVKAVKYLKMAVAQNDSLSMEVLGELYMSGSYVEKDADEGLRLIRAAADMGNVRGATLCAQMSALGQYLPKDDAVAFHYAMIGAKGGDVVSQVLLAKLYYFGQGTEKNLVEAARWFTAAAAKGDQESIDALKEDDLAAAAKQL